MNIPKNIRDFVGKESQIPFLHQKYSYPRTKSVDDLRDIASDLLLKDIRPFYEPDQAEVNSAIFNFLLEPLKNGNFYSENEAHPLEIELLLSPKGLVAGFCDGGSYFSRKEIKQYWESKKIHPEKTESEEPQIGYGIGTQFIYEMADLIHIDNLISKLFLGIKMGSIYLRPPKNLK